MLLKSSFLWLQKVKLSYSNVKPKSKVLRHFKVEPVQQINAQFTYFSLKSLWQTISLFNELDWRFVRLVYWRIKEKYFNTQIYVVVGHVLISCWLMKMREISRFVHLGFFIPNSIFTFWSALFNFSLFNLQICT